MSRSTDSRTWRSFGTGDATHSAPEGGQLRAFHLSSWTCDAVNCKDWSKLDLRVVVDGDSRRLPDTQGSYVVAIPAGAASVDLVMKTDDVRQSLSLLTGAPGPDNIAVLARQDRFVEIGESFPPDRDHDHRARLRGWRAADQCGA